jgi:hypothetical protein
MDVGELRHGSHPPDWSTTALWVLADLDAPPMQRILDVAKRPQEPDLEHHRQADTFGAVDRTLPGGRVRMARKLVSIGPATTCRVKAAQAPLGVSVSVPITAPATSDTASSLARADDQQAAFGSFRQKMGQ